MKKIRGQTLLLACVTFLLCAVMMMTSFSVATTIHEKIRIQATADSVAFTGAVLEARAFNTTAYLNRAIAATIVAEMGMHAWWAIAERDIDMFKAGKNGFYQIAAEEFLQCLCWGCQIHCVHGGKALKIAKKYSDKEREYRSDLDGTESDWKDSISKLNETIGDMYKVQKKTLKDVKGEIEGGDILKRIQSTSAPKSSLLGAVSKMGGRDLACAVEDTDFDGECTQVEWKGAGNTSSEKQKIMVSAAMAIRPAFESGSRAWRNVSNSGLNSALGMPIPLVQNPSEMMNIQSDGTYTEAWLGEGEAKIDDNGNISSDIKTAQVVITWQDGVTIPFTLPTRGKKNTSNNGTPCDGNGNCFVSFRLSTEAGETDFGQPATYGGVSQNLSKRRTIDKNPWELNTNGKLDIELVKGKPSELHLRSEDEGRGVAKAKTYFHQLGKNGWRTPPNFFDPFWRAKLHPFERKELSAVLEKAGDLDGSKMAKDRRSAVEGEVR
jgi:hypothetical protein